jgi:hypothetical protein
MALAALVTALLAALAFTAVVTAQQPQPNSPAQVTLDEQQLLRLGCNYAVLRAELEELYVKWCRKEAVTINEGTARVVVQINIPGTGKYIVEMGFLNSPWWAYSFQVAQR